MNDLVILNGNLELKFNKYTYEYTVIVDENINNLDFKFKLDDNYHTNVRDNNLEYEENIVYVDVFNEDETETYTFYVYKEFSNYSSGIDNYKKSLEVLNKVEEVDVYKLQLLSIGIFLSILIVFSILFRRKTIKK